MENSDIIGDGDLPVRVKRQGDYFQSRGQLSEAIACYREAIEHNPEYAEAFNNMGIAYKNQNRLALAVACYQRALKLKPEYAAACNNLGNACREQGHLDTAEHWYRKALQFQPGFAEACNNLGNVLGQTGRMHESVASYRSALNLKPDYVEAHNNLGNAYQEQKAYSQAIHSYQRALELQPGYHPAFNNLGNVYQKQGRLSRAIACYRQALALRPYFSEAYNSLANALVESGDIRQAIKTYAKALELNPGDTVAHSNLLLAMHYHGPAELLNYRSESEKWWQRHQGADPDNKGCAHLFDPYKRLKVGYVSPDFCRHSVGFFFLPLIRNHDPEGVETFCYAEVNSPDDVTEKIKSCCDHWRPTVGLSDDAVAAQVKSDGIDILVDLAGHTAGNRLPVFARRPAPVQATWLGYPGTTGMPVMDYRLTDEIADPPGQADSEYSETLMRLPEGFLCYRAPDDAPPVAALPARRGGGVTFGSFNNLPKLNPAVVALWSRLLLQVSDSGLLLKSRQFADDDVRRRYIGMFAANGVGAERLRLLPRTPSTAGHLALYDQVDIGLDPFPYNGTTTTCEALWMGVPVISLRGDRHAGRVGASLLTCVGLQAMIAESEEQYVQIGAKLAEDVDYLERLRAELRARLQTSGLCDAQRFAHNMETVLRALWHFRCSRQSNPNHDE